MAKRVIPLISIGVGAAALAFVLLAALRGVGMMPVAAAREAVLVDDAFDAMLRLTVPIFSVILATLLYCVLRFRRRPDAPDQDGASFSGTRSGLLETAWIGGSLVLTLGLAAFGTREYRMIRGDDHADLDIQVNASQWSWDFFYPAYNEYGTGLNLPKGKRVRLLLTSKDVIHSFWVPEFRVKQDAVPGRVVRLLLTPDRVGDYILLCAELCGTDHTIMSAKVHVMEPGDFEKAMKGEAW
jgi:cytochrome c oxidase subunit 2